MSKNLPIVHQKGPECSCKTCAGMCHRPCWPTPDEARAMIEAGLGSSLMFDRWDGDGFDGGNIYILAPANKGYEGKTAPNWPHTDGGCTFWHNGLCDIHTSGFKPIEGRLASCKDMNLDLHEKVAQLWNNAKDQDLAHNQLLDQD